VQRLVLGLRRKYRIWGLSRTDGYVRMPEAYVQLGMVWALSGQPGMAMAGLKQAMAMVPEERNSRVAQTIAGVYLDQGREKEGETIYRSALAKNPKATDALFGMARVLALQGKFDEAGAMLQRAEQAGAPHARVALAWAAVRLAAGEMGKARIALEELVELQPGLVPAWDMLADVLLAQADDPAIERLLERMKEVQGTELVRGFALARFCAGRNDQAGARRHGEDALRLSPGNVRVLVFVLDLDARQQRWDSAEKRAKRLLAVSPENAMAYHVLGSLHLMRGEHTLAEDFLRRSLALRENAETLNNLAWLLNERGAAADAEKAARRAIELDNKSPACWDTLGTILLRAGRLDEAGEALKRALEFAGAEPATLVHMAELQMRRGQTDRAAETLAALRLRQREMPQSDQKEVERLFREVERIRAAATPPGGGPRPGGAR
jgi:Tfp pilus assembly protein PilF